MEYDHPVWLFGVQPFDLSPAWGLTLEMEKRLGVLHSALVTSVKRVAQTPEGVTLTTPLTRSILAMGVESKGRIAFGKGFQVVLSSPLGNLETPEARSRFEEVVEQFLSFRPEVIAIDLHPDFYPGLYGRKMAKRLGIPVVAVQHHHAHGAAVLAEHGLEEALALTFDGMGWGEDGHLRGAELLHIHPKGYSRLASFVPVPLPGGDAAVRHPLRQLVGRFFHANVAMDESRQRAFGLKAVETALWERQCATGVHTPLSNAAGRLFDATAALLGIAPKTLTHEGEAAMALEGLASRTSSPNGPMVPFSTKVEHGVQMVDWSEWFRSFPIHGLSEDEKAQWAYAFHDAVARAACMMVAHGVERTGLRQVVLSGGVFMNKLLQSLLLPYMHHQGWVPILPQKLPVGDDAIVLGQVWIAGRGV